jgi:tRNA (uracil-5-)-methyltransferase TRM9
MNAQTRAILAEVNRAFYSRFAGDFAATRQSWPPGFQSILPYLAPAFNVLDLGCGNGRLLRFLVATGWRGRYIGLDSSAGLLAIAETQTSDLPQVQVELREADLLQAGWADLVTGPRPEAAAALAVLHHIPDQLVRAHFVAEAAACLAPGGILIMSTWQFMSTPRLRDHILPWARVGLRDADVEPGDYLLSWGQGAAGERYCAAIDETELRNTAEAAGLSTVGTWLADGHEGNLNLYGVFRRGDS